MKKLVFPVLILFAFIACEKDLSTELSLAQGNKGKKVKVCHKEGNGSFHTIEIDNSAVASHKAHGDIIPDEDGDGYTKTNTCGIGSQNDCDDNNSAINPGAKEICGNSKDDNCDGKIDDGCNAVTICDQTWTVVNLDVVTYRDGTPIPQISDPVEWANATRGAWCYYANNTANGTVYGKLYNWHAINGDSDGDFVKDKELAPVGWHVPTDAEWKKLTDCLGGANVAGAALKEAGTTHWAAPNLGATNSSGFTALPGGSRNNDGSFSFNNLGTYGFWWSSTTTSDFSVWIRNLDYSTTVMTPLDNNKNFGFSVRLVKD
jgi:uncharacterized protein (TIGR02145 family)